MSVPTFFRLRATIATILWLMVIIAIGAQAQEVEEVEEEVEEVEMVVTFVNEMPDTPIELFWENEDTKERKSEGIIQPRGGYIDVQTFVGHEFSYDLNGIRNYYTPPEPNALGHQFAILAGETPSIHVRCHLQRELDTTESEGGLVGSSALEITVQPYWAPRGASRFLELVRAKYYDGVALHRVVPQFLTQFGIAKDVEQRVEWDERPIVDDFETTDFQPGYVSFAGSGHDSRTTEIFIVMPGTDQEQLDYFGTNSWETPFAVVDMAVEGSVLSKIYDGYGDMPPWGNGPDSDRIYDEDGYTTYLPENFPKLDYIDRCYVVEEEGMDDTEAEL
mmetsp:Transcript_26363/g.56837  ORF Transcript_26363/g.56837 Transcript_26363/m.56837 type:complete len:333 (+) Transcript_26363:202-1200(+)